MRSAIRAITECALLSISKGTFAVSLLSILAFTELSAQSYDIGISDIICPHSLVDGNFTPKVVLTNYGSSTCTSASILYSINGANT